MAYEPARGMLRELQRDFDEPDGNFVEQFQTTGFDSRTFELFLFAMFKESLHAIDRRNQRPDFLLTKSGVTAAIEAVIASPPSDGPFAQPYDALPTFENEQVLRAYTRNDLAIRLGSPLFTKLNQQYWELPHVTGRPFVIAIQDFHRAGSLMLSSTTLANYLYGIAQHWYHDEQGRLVISEESVATHKSSVKEIPSGFFQQPNAEHVSAVLFSNSGTIPKFNRMGQEGSHRSCNVRMLRYGTCFKHDPDSAAPEVFLYEVGDPAEGRESWREGTVIIRNPRALQPLPAEWLGASAEEEHESGRVVSTFAEPFHPYWSLTMKFPGDVPQHIIQREANRLSQELQAQFSSGARVFSADDPK